jgi:hypothetical protein
MLLHDVRRARERREQAGNPRMMFGIVRQREGDQAFPGDLFQPHFARPRQRVRRMHGDTRRVALQLLERESGHDHRRQLDQQGDVQLFVAKSPQHFLSGQVVKLNPHAGTGTQFHLDSTIAQHLPLLGGVVGVGANGFYYQQISGDSGSGATLGDFEGRTVGVGPVLSYIRKLGQHKTLAAEVKWLPELNVEHRLKGDYIWFKVALLF